MRFADLTTEEAEEARAAGAVVLLPVGSIEPHGPHLPLSTDILIAEETARRAAARIEAPGYPVLVLPCFAYSTVEFSEGFAGATGLSASTARLALVELMVSLLSQRFLTVAIVNAHLEPAHIASLRSAVEEATMRSGRCPVFPDFTRRALAARLTEEFRSGACHAGRFETSMVMAIRPDLVKETKRRELPRLDVSLVDVIRAGRRSFREAGLDRAYCGDPASATAEEGQATLDVLAEIVAEEVAKAAS